VELFRERPTLRVDYDALIAHWAPTLWAVQAHLDLRPIDIPMMFDKRTHGTLEELILNYDEIRTWYASHPVLARYFEAAAGAAGPPGLRA
jgi:hypothetical protein